MMTEDSYSESLVIKLSHPIKANSNSQVITVYYNYLSMNSQTEQE